MPHPNNIILTGPPRSGTTLSCHLLNKLPNTIALHEPMNLKMFPDAKTGLQNIHDFFDEMRASLLRDGTALSKVKDGKVPDNPFENSHGGERKSTVQKGSVQFDKALDQDFKLVIKQNAHFSFLLEPLMKSYPCFAVIRNPLSTIASWNSITAPVSKGNLTVLKGIDPELHRRLDAIPDLLDRQVELAHILFEHYSVLPKEHIIQYEEIVDSQGKALKAIESDAANLSETLESRNRNRVYDLDQMKRIADALIAKNGSWSSYYDEAQILSALPN